MKMNKKGFTLVELLACIVVLTIVFGIAMLVTTGSINRARAKKARIHEDNLLEAAITYVYLAKSVCPNGTGTEAMTLMNCITQKCPSDFIIKNNEGNYIVNTRYSASSNPYKNCSVIIKAGDIMEGVNVSRDVNGTLQAGDQELFDGDKTNCNANGYVLVYKDEYGSLESISLTQDICHK